MGDPEGALNSWFRLGLTLAGVAIGDLIIVDENSVSLCVSFSVSVSYTHTHYIYIHSVSLSYCKSTFQINALKKNPETQGMK